MIIYGVLLCFVTAAVVVLTIFLVRLIWRAEDTLKTVNALLATTEQTMKETTTEINQNLHNLKKITDNINTFTSDIGSFGNSLKSIGDEVRELAENLKGVSTIVYDIGKETSASVSGLRVGVLTGIDFFLKNIFQKRHNR